MTCIAGLVQDGTVYIGGDSATSLGTSVTIKANHKVFCVDPFLIGVAGQPRVGQLLHFAFMPPPQDPADPDSYRYMVTTFVDAMRETLKAGGLAEKVNEHERTDSLVLIGNRGCLFKISFDYGITVAQDEFDAVGSGGQAARGALHASSSSDPVTRIRFALEAAEEFTDSVRGPFTIFSQRTRLVPPSLEIVECCDIELPRSELSKSHPDAGSSSSPAA